MWTSLHVAEEVGARLGNGQVLQRSLPDEQAIDSVKESCRLRFSQNGKNPARARPKTCASEGRRTHLVLDLLPVHRRRSGLGTMIQADRHWMPWGRWWRVLFTLGTLLHGFLAPLACSQTLLPWLSSSPIDPESKGLILIEALNCVACHSGSDALKARTKKAPRLSGLGSRANPAFLQAYLTDPHGTLPGTTMPDLLGRLSSEERTQAAREITHYLLSASRAEFALEAPDAVAADHGRRLFHSRGCAACHSPRDNQGKERSPDVSVPLGPLDRKYSLQSLTAFLRDPLASRPSGRMPDLRLPAREIERIAHFLLQDTRVPGHLIYTRYRGQVWEGLTSANVTAERSGHVNDFQLESLGKPEHHTAIRYEGWLNLPRPGRYTFRLVFNGGSLDLDGKRLLQEEPSDHRGVKSAESATDLDAGWHSIQLTYFHTGRQPRFSFEMQGPDFPRGPIPASMLSISKEPIPILEPLPVEPALAKRGRERFEKLGCAQCHDDLPVTPAPAGKALSNLRAAAGCLSDAPGPWPHFRLSEDQRRWIAQALPHVDQPRLSDSQTLDKALVTFQCTACHDRAGLGGIPSDRLALFTGTQPSLGDQGRLPPPLTHLGAKLRPESITDILLHGKRHRMYVDAAMPQFGEANVGHLAGLFAKVDALEAAPIPKVTDLPESKRVGHELIGSTGFSCIACHEFHGQKTGEFGSVDLAQVASRLQQNWFHLYLRQPARFHPTVIMPSYWPDGQSVRPEILGGDAGRQIEALWNYLEDGPRAKKPVGLSRESTELRVGDLPEICRGQGPAGYRSIGVGYPEGIHLVFDAGEMALRLFWKGEFASVDPGSFRPRGTDRFPFPPGIPFHRLQSLDEHWPYKGKNDHEFPRNHGYEFGGYHLDSDRRPTFLYRYGEIGVEDFFEDARDAGGTAYFKRTIRFQSPHAAAPFYFRAAAGKGIQKQDDHQFVVGERLRLRIASDAIGVVRDGDPGEVLIRLSPPPGTSTLQLEYQW